MSKKKIFLKNNTIMPRRKGADSDEPIYFDSIEKDGYTACGMPKSVPITPGEFGGMGVGTFDDPVDLFAPNGESFASFTITSTLVDSVNSKLFYNIITNSENSSFTTERFSEIIATMPTSYGYPSLVDFYLDTYKNPTFPKFNTFYPQPNSLLGRFVANVVVTGFSGLMSSTDEAYGQAQTEIQINSYDSADTTKSNPLGLRIMLNVVNDSAENFPNPYPFRFDVGYAVMLRYGGTQVVGQMSGFLTIQRQNASSQFILTEEEPFSSCVPMSPITINQMTPESTWLTPTEYTVSAVSDHMPYLTSLISDAFSTDNKEEIWNMFRWVFCSAYFESYNGTPPPPPPPPITDIYAGLGYPSYDNVADLFDPHHEGNDAFTLTTTLATENNSQMFKKILTESPDLDDDAMKAITAAANNMPTLYDGSQTVDYLFDAYIPSSYSSFATNYAPPNAFITRYLSEIVRGNWSGLMGSTDEAPGQVRVTAEWASYDSADVETKNHQLKTTLDFYMMNISYGAFPNPYPFHMTYSVHISILENGEEKVSLMVATGDIQKLDDSGPFTVSAESPFSSCLPLAPVTIQKLTPQSTWLHPQAYSCAVNGDMPFLHNVMVNNFSDALSPQLLNMFRWYFCVAYLKSFVSAGVKKRS